MARPLGIVTFLFTDIEGSTRRWEADAAAMRADLADHDVVVRSAIEGHGGWLFKHTGDGVCAAFDSPHGAIDAAIAAQRQLTIPVRMGIASGEAYETGGDYFGPVLNRVARVMDAGHGGQVLVAASTAALVDGVDLLDLGEYRLRDLAAPTRLFQVHAPGLAATFPPLRTLEETAWRSVGRADLPVATVRLIGRDDDVAAIAALVLGERLVTLTGSGGVGKTELALAVATAIEGSFSDGAWWVDLATLDPGRDVEPMVSAVLGVRERRDADVVDVIAEALGARHVLVVTDNCEHVLASTAELVGGLLRRCPNVKVLATSRRRLGVRGERTVVVRPLRAGGIDAPAFELLTDRIGDSFDNDERQQGALEEIAQRLGGVPLALELAAGRCRTMTPTDVLARMADHVRFVEPLGVDGERSTLWGALRWSYDLLEPAVQGVFSRLSVFAGPFSLGACELVAGAGQIDRNGVDDAVSELVEASLVEHDAGRYRLLETTRQFGRDLLVSHGAADHVMDRHLSWILDAVAEAHLGLRGPDELTWVQRVDEQWSDIRAAFHRALERDDPSAAILLASHLVYDAFWRRPEALGWIVEANRRFGDIPHPQQADLLGAAGVAAWALGDAHEALALGRRASALESASEPAFDRLAAQALATGLAWVGDLNGAVDVSATTAASLDEDPFLQAVWLSNLAAMNVFAGRVELAKEPASRAMAIARAMGNPTLLAYCSMFQAVSHMMDPPIAHKLFGDAARIAVGVRNRFVERDAASMECFFSMILGAPPQDVLDRLLRYADDRQRGGWVLHTWMEFGRIAEVLAALDRPADAAIVALATLRSPAGAQMAASLNDLLQRLAAEVSQDDVKELEDLAATLSIEALLALAAPKS